MVRTTTYDYEVSSENGRERHIRVPYTRLTDQTPTLHDPAEIVSLLPGTAVTGTVITIDAVRTEAIVNTAPRATYWHNVRNVLTYNVGAENTWGAINVGDPVYYDASATMPANTWLSTAPANNVAAANTLFGWVVMRNDETAAASFPKGGAAGSTQECAICQK
jgi:hypothetical protein